MENRPSQLSIRQNSIEIPIPMKIEHDKKSNHGNDDDYEMEFYLRRLAMFRTLQDVLPIKDDDLSDNEDEYYSYGIGPTEVINLQKKLEEESESDRYRGRRSPGLSEYDVEGSTDIDGSIDVSLNSASISEDQEHQFDIEV